MTAPAPPAPSAVPDSPDALDTPSPTAAPVTSLNRLPGYQIRRLQQIAVALFLQETEGTGITPVQFAALQTVALEPGIDQRRLAGRIGLDTSTIGGVVDRLESRGLLQRQMAAHDRRVRCLSLTDEGQAQLAAVVPGMQRAQDRILAPLTQPQRDTFVDLLDRIVQANNAASRAPSDPPA